MPDLSTPLRVTWDLPQDPSLAARIWTRLREGRVLFVEIRVRPGADAVLAGLRAEPRDRSSSPPPRITLLGDPATLITASAAPGLMGAAAERLMLVSEAPEPGLRQEMPDTKGLVPSVWGTREGLGGLREALSLARRHGCRSVAVLNPPAPAAALTDRDRRRAVRVWREHAGSGMELRVHDLFLAEALGQEPFQAYGGCQAGDVLAHVDVEGTVTACRTLPEPFGRLTAVPLAELWAGAARRRFRIDLAAVPPECRPCSLAARCGGGCRGLSPVRGRDPSCPGVRTVTACGACA